MIRLIRWAWCAVVLIPAVAWGAAVPVLNGPQVQLGTAWTLVDAQTINATGSYSSDALDLTGALFFGAWYQCTSASGSPDVQIEWLESPTTEDTDFVSVVTLESSLTAETATLKTVSPPPMRYGRVTITGNGPNPADTVCTLKLFLQGGRP